MRLLFALALAASTSALAAPNDAYVQELQARGRSLKLAESAAWLRLVHYRPSANGGWKSDADGPLFFNAPSGRRDPQAELDATIAAAFGEQKLTKEGDREIDPPQCRFPARLAWLNEQLGFDLTKVPPVQCPRLMDFLQRVNPRSATLVFSSYYMNNPASAFGHTFLRFNKAPRGQRGKQDELRDYAINFSATVTTDNKFLYGLFGLTGGFHGDWAYQLYFYKVREYSEYESRDLWEYDLNLTPKQLAMLVAHVWELGWTWFDYFYLDENCSFHILAALEAAAPELRLTNKVGYVFVAPSDTVRAVATSPNLVGGIYYRPSIRVQFEARAKDLDDEALEWVRKLDDDQETKLPESWSPQLKAAVFDASLDFVDLRDARALIHQTDEVVTKRKQRLLERRAEIKIPSPPLNIEPLNDKQPHLGHLSSRFGFGAGVDADGQAFGRYSFRASFHDFADAARGYPELAMVEFFTFKFRHNTPFENFMLEEAYFARIESLNAWTRFDKSTSWKLRIGAATLRDGGCATPGGVNKRDREGRCVAFELAGGTGLTFNLIGDKLTLFGMTDAALHASSPIDGPWGAPVRLSAGPSLGLRGKITDRFTAFVTANYWFHAERALRRSWTATATGRIHLNERFAVDLEAKTLNFDGSARPDAVEGGAMMLLYF